MATVFAICVAFLLYTYLVYPLVIILWGVVFPRRVAKRYAEVPLSVVLAVYNEEKHIEERIRNLLDQDYPEEMIEVIVVSDNSTDRTAEIASGIADERVRVFQLEDAQGKAAAINLGVEKATNELIVFADARQRFGENVFAELSSMFHDDIVGAVSGELVIRRGGSTEVAEGVGLYWQYEKLIRRMESEVHSVVGASGSIYAIRKSLFTPLPPRTILDDFLTPMRIVLQGYRVIFVRSAKAFDWASQTTKHEFARKVRTLAGNFQAFSLEKALLDPRKNKILFQMVSHKITRLFAPYFVVGALISNFFLSGPVYQFTLALQLMFYSAVLLRFTPVMTARFGGFVRVAWTFTVLNAAAVMALWVYLSGKDKLVWKKSRP